MSDPQPQQRRSTDCPEWTQEPMKKLLEKLDKIDDLVTNMAILTEQVKHTKEGVQASLEKLEAREVILSQLILAQTKQETGLKIFATVAMLLFPFIIGWNVYLHAKLDTLKTQLTTLEAKR